MVLQDIAGKANLLRPVVSVVIPCHNEASVLNETHRRISVVCRELVGTDYEIVFVNDGSTDMTWEKMLSLSDSDAHLVCVDLSRNFGHQQALMTGLRISRGQRVLVIDADLQDPPELLAEMMRRMDEGADVVYGLRSLRHGESWAKRFTANLFYRMLNRVADIEIPSDVGDFRLMSRVVVDNIILMPEAHPYVRGLVAWTGFRQVAQPYERAARHDGRSSYSFARMIALALDGLTGFSTAPLRLMIWIASVALGFSLLLMCWALYGWIALDVVPGWTSLFSLTLFMGSIQLLALGVIGEYVGRSYMETKRRPGAVIRTIVAKRKEQTS